MRKTLNYKGKDPGRSKEMLSRHATRMFRSAQTAPCAAMFASDEIASDEKKPERAVRA
jgi:hypothetical protein